MEEVMMKACKLDAIIDKLLENGDANSAKSVQNMLDQMLASEQMRKKDEKPIEHFTLAGWEEAFEKFGFMREKDFVSKEEMMNRMADLIERRDKYSQPLDIAHQVLMNVVNNAKKNADQPMIDTLPAWMECEDQYGECAREPSEEYKRALRYCGTTEVKFDKSKGKPAKEKTAKKKGKG